MLFALKFSCYVKFYINISTFPTSFSHFLDVDTIKLGLCYIYLISCPPLIHFSVYLKSSVYFYHIILGTFILRFSIIFQNSFALSEHQSSTEKDKVVHRKNAESLLRLLYQILTYFEPTVVRSCYSCFPIMF